MMTVILFLLILSLLVLVHEFGHFITARLFGMRVFEFGMGFPPRMFGVYRDPRTKRWVWVWGRGKSTLQATVGGEERLGEYPATLYSMNWLPIGGFCKIKGESGEAASAKDSFAHYKPGKRLVVLVAGVVMNFLLAAVLLGIGFTIGLPTDVSGGLDRSAIVVQSPRIMVQQVGKETPAELAGIKSGDVIVGIDGTVLMQATALMEYVREAGAREMQLTLEREGQTVEVAATPAILPRESDDVPRLGVVLADAAIIRYPWYIAIGKGFVAAVTGLISIFLAFGILIKNLVLGRGLAFDVSGPVGIASLVGESARLGIQYLINITAMISLSLAALNILPIPALDGGRALFVVIEKIIRRPVPMKYEQTAHTVGFVLLMLLIIVVTWRDVAGLLR